MSSIVRALQGLLSFQENRTSAQNAENNLPNDSPILNLPRELLDSILSHLRTDELISFRLTCRNLYQSNPPMTVLVEELRTSISFDGEGAWLYLAEGTWARTKGLHLCSGCRKYQPRAQFDDGELTMNARQRKCIAYTARMYFTPDHSLSFVELASRTQDRISNLDSIGSNHASNLQNSCRFAMWWPDGWRGQDPSSPYVPTPVYLRGNTADGDYLYYTWCFSFDTAQSPPASVAEIGEELGKSVVDLCPHIKSDDRRYIEAFHHCQHLRPVLRDCASSVSCSRCGMRSTVLCRADNSRIIIEVERRLGKLVAAWDPQWLANVDNPPRVVTDLVFQFQTSLRYLARSRFGSRLSLQRCDELKSVAEHLKPENGSNTGG